MPPARSRLTGAHPFDGEADFSSQDLGEVFEVRGDILLGV
jgi:hypothetical protein